jgi:hypothetical protein
MEPHLYQERIHPVNRLTNLGLALIAFALLAAIIGGGATVTA